MKNGKIRISKKYASFSPLIKHLLIIVSSLLILFFIIIFLPRPIYKDGFRNLSELKEYAATIDEFIKVENNNFDYPLYDRYYHKNFSYTLGRNLQEKFVWFFSSLGLMRKPIFSASFFKTLLADVTKVRQQKGWVGNFVQKFEATPTSKTIVFGSVHGAFHCLVRHLDKLKELDIIDENLKILQSDYRFIFLGNVINRSPYTLEIFSIVLRLLQLNPDNVVYLKNSNELPGYWRNHTLRRELEIRAAYLSGQDIPLAQEVDVFFSTLSMNVYCTIPFVTDQMLPYVKFSSKSSTMGEAKDLAISDFLKKRNTKLLEFFDLKNIPDESINNVRAVGGGIVLKAIVKDIRKRDVFEQMDGLRLLNLDDNIATWTVFSTAAGPYCEKYGLVYDAFVIITPAKELDKWLITLYNRDVRDKDMSFKTRSCYFFTGGNVKNTNIF